MVAGNTALAVAEPPRAELEHRAPGQDPISEWRAMRAQADALVKSGFLPKAINTAEKAIAVIQTGKELGIGPMQALRSIQVIDGKPTLAAELIAGLVLSRVPGSILQPIKMTSTECVVRAQRPGGAPLDVPFTIEDAKRAGLLGKANWKNYPRAMLRSRAITEAARAVFPDATMGLYDPDELGAVTSETGEVISVPTEVKQPEPTAVYLELSALIGATESLDALHELLPRLQEIPQKRTIPGHEYQELRKEYAEQVRFLGAQEEAEEDGQEREPGSED